MIDKLSDQEKSDLLFRLTGWVETTLYFSEEEATVPGWGNYETMEVIERLDLYNPLHMALAWRVLNWAIGDPSFGHDVDHWLWNDGLGYDLPNLPPADAQRQWLDKILTLAIEAGIVDIKSTAP